MCRALCPAGRASVLPHRNNSQSNWFRLCSISGLSSIFVSPVYDVGYQCGTHGIPVHCCALVNIVNGLRLITRLIASCKACTAYEGTVMQLKARDDRSVLCPTAVPQQLSQRNDNVHPNSIPFALRPAPKGPSWIAMALESILGHDRVQRQNRLVRMLRACPVAVIWYPLCHAGFTLTVQHRTEARSGRQRVHSARVKACPAAPRACDYAARVGSLGACRKLHASCGKSAFALKWRLTYCCPAVRTRQTLPLTQSLPYAQMALSLLAASGGLLYYYLNKEDRDMNRNYGELLAGHACGRRGASRAGRTPADTVQRCLRG